MSSGSANSEPANTSTQNRHREGRPRPLAVLVGLVIVVSAVGLLAVLLFPWQSLTSQRRSIDHAADTLERLQAETSHLAAQVADAKDPVVVERIAREQLSLVREGDTLYRLNVDPADVITLPAAWPLPGVAHLLGDGDG
ncbi:FtsB family cell division protein [Candidatus Poriferisodalis sp.]|uniref:FtsB family cell division protein n=1 Tax=Candidatus Poriferisodalis sp. TaxID=3101277 RepID=UPI003B027A02